MNDYEVRVIDDRGKAWTYPVRSSNTAFAVKQALNLFGVACRRNSIFSLRKDEALRVDIRRVKR